MLRKLVMDEIHEGMYITVLRGKVIQRTIPGNNGPIVIHKEDDEFNGKVLEVVSLEMPYILVNYYSSCGVITDSLDLRLVEVMRISKKYVTTYCPDIKYKEPDPFWDEETTEVLKDL